MPSIQEVRSTALKFDLQIPNFPSSVAYYTTHNNNIIILYGANTFFDQNRAASLYDKNKNKMSNLTILIRHDNVIS